MRRLVLLFLLVPAAAAQSPTALATLGVGNSGRGAHLSVGTDLGTLSPEVFLARTVGADRAGTASRTQVGLVGRLSVLNARRVELSAAAGLSYAAAREASPLLRADGTRGRDLTREGLAALFGAEATAWLTERVGLSAFAHQSVEARAFEITPSERFPTGRPDGSQGVVAAPQLSQWSVGVGLRVGRR